MDVIEIVRLESKNFSLLELISSIGNEVKNIDTNRLVPISIKMVKLEDEINSLLRERESNPLDIPIYDNKFWKEEDVFENRQYKGKKLKLCKTGFDNAIIFLLNIFDSLIKDSANENYYLFATNNHTEFEDWLIKKTSGPSL
jgi:hypothetical protein